MTADPTSGHVDARQARGVQVGDHNHQEINDQRQFHLYDVTGRAVRQLTAPAGRDPSWSPPPVVGRIPPWARGFRDRCLFAGLVEALGDERGVRPPVVLSGLGGAGKTQLAAAYARSRRDGPEPVLVVWIDASSPDAIVSRYAQAGAQVIDADEADPQRAAEQFLAWSATTSHRWLIVLDDLRSPADLTGLWPEDSAWGRTVITTRRGDIALAGERIDVPVFTEEEARGYLGAALPAHLADDVTGVAADLGRLPVALSQAAAYMADQGVRCSDYRTRLGDHRSHKLIDLTPAADAMPDEHRHAVAATWTLSITAADAATPRGFARPLIELASMLDPNGIPIAVLTSRAAGNWLSYSRSAADGAPWQDTDAETVRAGLRRLHLSSLVTVDDDAKIVGIHGLLQRAVRDQLASDALPELAWAAAEAVREAWSAEHAGDAEFTARLRANVLALQDHAGEHLWDDDGPHPILVEAGDSLGRSGQVAAAAGYFRRLLVAAEQRLGHSDRRTLGIRGKIVQWSGQAGDPASIMEAGELLTDRTRFLGAHDSDTLTARHTLACLHLQRGDPAAAAAELRSLLADRIRLLGADHPHSVTTRHNLALSLADLGEVTEAIEEFDRVFADSVRLLGRYHRDTLSTRHDLLRLRTETGELDDPVAAFQELVDDRTRVLGPDDPDTLVARFELAGAIAATGDHATALDAYDVLLQDRLRVLGPDHPDTLLARLHHLACGWHCGAMPDAEALVEQVAADATRVLGVDHRHVGMAHTLGATIRVDGAEKAVASCRNTHGADHVQTLQARCRLVSARFEAQDLDNAAHEAGQLIADLDRVLGPYDTNTLATRSVLAVIRGVAGDPAGAVSQLESLLADMERELSPDRDEFLVVRHQLDAFRAFAADSP